jgi:hypothetical protein
MSRKEKINVIWVDFKTKREHDLSKLGHPEKFVQPVPYLCQINKSKITNRRIK